MCESAAQYEGGAYVDWTGMGIIASNGLLQPEKRPKLPPCMQRFLQFLTEELNELIAGYLQGQANLRGVRRKPSVCEQRCLWLPSGRHPCVDGLPLTLGINTTALGPFERSI